MTTDQISPARESRDTAAGQRVQLRDVLLLGGLTTFGPLATDLYLPALPAVQQQLGSSVALAQITLTICILGLALGQALIGPISDARGRRWPLLLGIGAFALVSLLCSLAPSIGVLAGLRFAQGLAGAAGLVIALAVARDLYSGVALARCISMLMTVNFLAPIVAPVLGGQLLRVVSWRGLFVFLALLSTLMLGAVALLLSESLPREARRSGGIAATVQAFRALLGESRFLGYALVCGFAFSAGIVYISSSPFVLQTLYGLSPQRFSLVFGANAVGLAVVSQVSARLVERLSPFRLLLAGALAIAAAGIVLLLSVLLGGGLFVILPALFVLTASLGLIAPNATALALADIKPDNAGSASALLGVLQLVIGALVAPLVGLAGTASALPMAAVVAGFGIAALAVLLIFCRPARNASTAGV